MYFTLDDVYLHFSEWVASVQDRDLLESPCDCGTELPGSISHGVKLKEKRERNNLIIYIFDT